MAFLDAQTRFRLNSPSGYNQPKSRFMFYVNFVSRFLDPVFLRSTSFFVKTFERINVTYDVQEVNQYNKKRLVQTGIKYGPLALSFYDVVDNQALKLVEAYNRFYYGDFRNKNNNSWNYDITTNNFESSPNWGLASDQSPNNAYFFDRIELFEMYDQTYTKVNFVNPKFTSIDFQTFDSEATDFSIANMVCKHEGIVIEKVNELISPELADMFGLEFRSDTGLPTGAYRIPGVTNLIGSATNLLSNVISSFGLGPFISDNIANSLVNSGLDNIGPKINTTFGSATFNSLAQTGQLISSVNDRNAAGFPIRDIATGSFTNGSKQLFI